MYSQKKQLHIREKDSVPGTLRSIALDVTTKCNMHCKFCYAETFRDIPPTPLGTLKKALNEAYQMGVTHYILQGGEVCADWDRLTAILPMLYPDETYINVVSNGWHMTRDRIEELKSMQVDKISFSLDSGIREEHDQSRQEGSFDRVLSAIDHVLQAGLLCGISTVVTHQSLHEPGFQAAYDYAKRKGIRFDVQIAEPVGKWDGNLDCLISKDDAEYIYSLYRNSPIMENGQTMVKRDLYRTRNGKCEVCCPAGTEFMAITADGNFLPCNFIQATLGNIRDKSLRTMRDDLLRSPWFSQKHPRCILGEDSEYIKQFVLPHVGKKKPLDAYQLFKLR